MNSNNIQDFADVLGELGWCFLELWRDTMRKLSTPISVPRKNRVFAIRISPSCVEFRRSRFRPRALTSETYFDGNLLKQVWHKGGKVIGAINYDFYYHCTYRYDHARYGKEFRVGTIRELPSTFAAKILDPKWSSEHVGFV